MVSLTCAGRGRENKPGLYIHVTSFTTQYTHFELYISQVEVERINLVCIFTWLYSLLNTLTPNYINIPVTSYGGKGEIHFLILYFEWIDTIKAIIKGINPSKVRWNDMDDTNSVEHFQSLTYLDWSVLGKAVSVFWKTNRSFSKKPVTKLSFLVF